MNTSAAQRSIAAPSFALIRQQAAHRGLSRRNAYPRNSWRRLATRAAVGLSSVLGTRRNVAFGILTYHRIAEPCVGHPPPTWNVTPKQFRRHMTELLARNYCPWPLRKLIDYARSNRPVPRGVFVVTFDDAFEGVYCHAWPVLRELDIPATVFVATAYLDSQNPFPFDDWPAAGSADVPAQAWRPLSTAQCRAMLQDSRIELGTHTHTHDDFRGRPEALREELLNSLEVLHDRFGLRDVPFSFPFGIAGEELAAAAQAAGVSCSLSNQGDVVTAGADPFTWGRISVDANDTGRTLAAKLDGWYSLARDAWRRFKSPFDGTKN